MDVVGELDFLLSIKATLIKKKGGQSAFAPKMIVSLLIYIFTSSRGIPIVPCKAVVSKLEYIVSSEASRRDA